MKNISENNKGSRSKRIHPNNQKGFVEFIVVIIVALVILHFLGIDIKTLLAKEWVQNFAIYVRDMLRFVWADLLEIFAFIRNIAK